jgi:hypothetical protein
MQRGGLILFSPAGLNQERQISLPISLKYASTSDNYIRYEFVSKRHPLLEFNDRYHFLSILTQFHSFKPFSFVIPACLWQAGENVNP